MKCASLIAAFGLALVVATGPAGAQPANQFFQHWNPDGTPDAGTQTPLPGGGTQTTYGDGWTRIDQPDNSFGPGGTQITEKDGNGRIQEITKVDKNKTIRHRTRVTYNPNGTMTLTYWNYRANGQLIDTKTETTQAPPPSPPGGPQTAQPGPGGAPPGYGGPPPESGPGFGGPVFGGFGFGVTIGGDRDSDRGRRP